MTAHGESASPGSEDYEFTTACQAAQEASKWWIKTPDNEFFPRDEVPWGQTAMIMFYKDAKFQEPGAKVRKLGGVYDRVRRIWVGHWLPKD